MIPKTLIIGAALSAVFIVAALLSFLWTPFDHTQLAIANKLKTPSLTHWFGTDHFGRDIFSMIMVGARTSIAVAVIAVGIGIALIAILITAVFGPSAINAIIAIGIFNTPVFARITRGAAISLWSRDFLLAARVAGKGKARISLEHILPNILNLLIVQGRRAKP